LLDISRIHDRSREAVGQFDPRAPQGLTHEGRSIC
jgi:hypothetical protein